MFGKSGRVQVLAEDGPQARDCEAETEVGPQMTRSTLWPIDREEQAAACLSSDG